jgi:hypothetical protein
MRQYATHSVISSMKLLAKCCCTASKTHKK